VADKYKALASRKVFLPTIAHALINISSSHTWPSPLRKRLAALAEKRLETECPAQAELTRQSIAEAAVMTQPKLEQILWQSIHRRLVTTTTHRRLRPMLQHGPDQVAWDSAGDLLYSHVGDGQLLAPDVLWEQLCSEQDEYGEEDLDLFTV